ncbi:MAG: dephospho-CoA kinase [Burkholderiaceae bacterium]|nr:MAG: dephospho-CoA kinase [Burkholderiaceae bacterium]|tara:strand:- start:316 stop:927 length:612 start_codon:yes stop_codon:yes gene_type:complete
MTKIVILTGGIGAGKTTVEEIFSSLGVETLDADQITSNLLDKNTRAYKKIVEIFGQSILTNHEEINRPRMRKIIFRDKVAKKKLEGILHPQIRSVMNHEVKKATGRYILQVIPLWFEVYGEERPADIWKIIVVETSTECRKERTLRRSKTDMDTFDLILSNQATDSERRKIADDIIFNQGSIGELRLQVNSIHERYINCLKKT